MRHKLLFKLLLWAGLSFFAISGLTYAQRTGYSKAELVGRRGALMEAVKNGVIILFGEAQYVRSGWFAPGAHFRQDNDFYYFTGNEDWNTILMMIPQTKQSFLFLPRLTASEIRSDGINLLEDEEAQQKTGMTRIFELSYFSQVLAQNVGRYKTIYLRMISRGRVQSTNAKKDAVNLSDQISLDNYRIQKIKERFPYAEIRDITPFIDAMRVIKTPAEIAVSRRIGKISADGVKQAMLTTRPGVFEYEIEAAAMHAILKHGAKGAGYPPIVGSGINTCTLHYWQNSKQIEDGDLILMDFGGDLDYQMVDITRTWPANGRFTAEQREAYQVVLEVQKACIEAYRPGITAKDVQEYVAEVMKQKGMDPRGLRGGIGHYVGMEVHDVGPRGVPLKEGMVFAIEPALYYPEKGFGIRIEDTVLITKNGCEVLTKDVPKEIDEIEKLMTTRK
jgi:Xaa-Pro aminopeptidase